MFNSKTYVIMKKVVLFVLMACMVMPMTADAQNKALQKALKREKKEKMKEYKKENWKLFGSSRTLEVALLTHYDKLEQLGEDGREIAGTVSRANIKNVAHQRTINDACITYAQQAGSSLQGRVLTDMADVSDGESFDHFYAAYERLVEKEIQQVMDESYSIIRDNGDGTFDMQTFFVVSESAATKARIRAMEDALKESEAAQRYAQKISDFVKAGFEK